MSESALKVEKGPVDPHNPMYASPHPATKLGNSTVSTNCGSDGISRK